MAQTPGGKPPRKRAAARGRRRTPPTATKLIRAADVQPEELEFLWLDRIPLGCVTLVGGRPGQGKSLFTNYLAAQVTRNGGAVIMSNPEDQLAQVRVPRLMAAEADARLVHFWPGKLRLPADVDELEELVVFHGVQLVTVDPIAKHVVGKDPNTALEPLAAMAERRGCAVVGVHHLNKRLARDAHPQEAFGGASGGWLGSVRFAHVLGPAAAGEPESRFLAVAKSNYGDDEVPAVEFYMDVAEIDLPNGSLVEAPRLVFVAADAKVHASAVVQWKGVGFKREGSPEKKAVAMEFLTLLLAKGPCPANEVYDEGVKHGVTKMTCRRASEELGVVKSRVGYGPGSYLLWSLPDDHPLMKSIGELVEEEGGEQASDASIADAVSDWLASLEDEEEEEDDDDD